MSEEFSAILSLIGGILLFAVILFLAWFCTRWLAGRYGGARSGTGGQIKVLERVSIGNDRTLLIVRTGGKVWLLGVTSHHIEGIGELDPDQFPETEETEGAQRMPDFSAALKNALKGWTPGKK